MENNEQPTLGNGKLCYIEIPALDINCSASFYQTVFGWKVRTRDNGSVAFDDGVGQVSGTWTTRHKPAAQLGLLVYIMVDNIHGSMEAVIANGGKIIQPIGLDVPELTARFTDPAGNIFGLYQQPSKKE